jgi:hypothetical protein
MNHAGKIVLPSVAAHGEPSDTTTRGQVAAISYMEEIHEKQGSGN